jgi:lysophospholipase
MADAPVFNDLALGPPGGRAHWLTASDGVRLRMAHWPAAAERPARATVVLLPGRTEYIEKYGQVAAAFCASGHPTAVIDWRGQGLSDRSKPDRMLGDVCNFRLYQKDLQAFLQKLDELGQGPRYHMVSHSMGGCIGLRALMRPHPFRSASFSAPMWGIQFKQGIAPAARTLALIATTLGKGRRYAPGSGAQTYVATTGFSDNILTRDPDTFSLMQAQARAQPALPLGGPSLQWLHHALTECNALAALPSPDIPAYCALGTAEKIVAPGPIHSRMRRWPKGRLDLIPDAEHEVMMEIPPIRARFFDAATALFAATA